MDKPDDESSGSEELDEYFENLLQQISSEASRKAADKLFEATAEEINNAYRPQAW